MCPNNAFLIDKSTNQATFNTNINHNGAYLIKLVHLHPLPTICHYIIHTKALCAHCVPFFVDKSTNLATSKH